MRGTKDGITDRSSGLPGRHIYITWGTTTSSLLAVISTALSPCLHSASTSKLKPITFVRCHARLCNRSRARSDRKCRRPPSQCELQHKREYPARPYLHLYTHLYTHLRPRCKPTALSRHLLRPHRYQALPATARAGRQPSDWRCSATADRL